MSLSRTAWLRVVLGVVIVLAALLLLRLHHAGGATLSPDSAAAGHRLAEAWCKDCHAIAATTASAANGPPDFVVVANRPSTTELSLKVFLRTNHPSMPNLILKPDESDSLVNYILSLKRN